MNDINIKYLNIIKDLTEELLNVRKENETLKEIINNLNEDNENNKNIKNENEINIEDKNINNEYKVKIKQLEEEIIKLKDENENLNKKIKEFIDYNNVVDFNINYDQNYI